MKESWKYEILGNVCDVLDSKRKPITKNKRVPGTVPYYGATGVLDFVKDFIFDEKLVLLGEDGAKWGAGELSSYIINGKSWVNNHAHTLRPKRYIISDEFLVYYLNYSNLLDYVSGTTVPKLNQANMRRIEIPLPTLSDQQKIVDLLDAEFEKIDAIKANAASQLQSAKDLFQAALKDNLTPKEGWEKKKVGDCFISINNGANIKQTKGAGGIPITRIETLSNGVFNKDRVGYANIDDASRYSKYILKDGDLLMSHINSVEFVGRTVVFHDQLPIVIHGMNLLRLVPNTTAISDFYYYAFKAPWFRSQLEPIIHKSVNQASMNTTALKQVNIYIPNKEEQQKIASRLDAISEKVKALQANYDKTITLCNDLKQSLLKSIFA